MFMKNFKCDESKKCGEPGVFCACRCAGGIAIVVALLLVFGLVVQCLWNWLIPAVFMTVGKIGYLQALGLLVLTRILFGGCGHRGRHGWGFGKGWHGHSQDGCCGTEDGKEKELPPPM
jgi:hypothetical protein